MMGKEKNVDSSRMADLNAWIKYTGVGRKKNKRKGINTVSRQPFAIWAV